MVEALWVENGRCILVSGSNMEHFLETLDNFSKEVDIAIKKMFVMHRAAPSAEEQTGA